MGYWEDKKPKPENFATKDDIKALDKKLEKLAKQENESRLGSAKKVAGNVMRGINNIAESLNTPSTARRMKIGQMPARKPPIARTRPQNPIAGRNAGMRKHRISDAPLD